MKMTLVKDLRESKPLRFWLILVVLISVLLRVLLFTTYPPVSYNDTSSYRRSADAVLGGFEVYDGTRTPGYPMFMALVGSDRAVYAVQLILGLAITLAWFLIGWQASHKPAFAGLAALAYTLNPDRYSLKPTCSQKHWRPFG